MVVEMLPYLDRALDLAKRLREIAKNVQAAEFNDALSRLIDEAADLRVAGAQMKEDYARLIEENLDLKARLSKREAVKPLLVEGLYQFPEEEGLYCTACYDVRSQKIRVAEKTDTFRVFGRYTCPVCKTNYK